VWRWIVGRRVLISFALIVVVSALGLGAVNQQVRKNTKFNKAIVEVARLSCDNRLHLWDTADKLREDLTVGIQVGPNDDAAAIARIHRRNVQLHKTSLDIIETLGPRPTCDATPP